MCRFVLTYFKHHFVAAGPSRDYRLPWQALLGAVGCQQKMHFQIVGWLWRGGYLTTRSRVFDKIVDAHCFRDKKKLPGMTLRPILMQSDLQSVEKKNRFQHVPMCLCTENARNWRFSPQNGSNFNPRSIYRAVIRFSRRPGAGNQSPRTLFRSNWVKFALRSWAGSIFFFFFRSNLFGCTPGSRAQLDAAVSREC